MTKLKDKKIRLLYIKTQRPDGSITPVKSWLDCGISMDDVTEWEDLPGGERLATAPTRPLWAYFRSLSGREIYAANQQVVLEEVLFIVNWQSSLSPAMRVMFKGDMYEIVRVDALEGGRSDLRLYCKKTAGG